MGTGWGTSAVKATDASVVEVKCFLCASAVLSTGAGCGAKAVWEVLRPLGASQPTGEYAEGAGLLSYPQPVWWSFPQVSAPRNTATTLILCPIPAPAACVLCRSLTCFLNQREDTCIRP